MSIFTEHPHDTENPQTYFQHCWFAIMNCCLLQVAIIAGFIHAFCPWWFKFYTSTQITRCFKRLADCRRHVDELNRELGEDYLVSKHIR